MILHKYNEKQKWRNRILRAVINTIWLISIPQNSDPLYYQVHLSNIKVVNPDHKTQLFSSIDILFIFYNGFVYFLV